jgi:hypothetical protein
MLVLFYGPHPTFNTEFSLAKPPPTPPSTPLIPTPNQRFGASGLKVLVLFYGPHPTLNAVFPLAAPPPGPPIDPCDLYTKPDIGFWEIGRIFAIQAHPTSFQACTLTNEAGESGCHAAWYFVVVEADYQIICHPLRSYGGQGFGARQAEGESVVAVYPSGCRKPACPRSCRFGPLEASLIEELPGRPPLIVLSMRVRLTEWLPRVRDIGMLKRDAVRKLVSYSERCESRAKECAEGDGLEPEIVIHDVTVPLPVAVTALGGWGLVALGFVVFCGVAAGGVQGVDRAA